MSAQFTDATFRVKIFNFGNINVSGLVKDLWVILYRFLNGLIDSCRLDYILDLVREKPRLLIATISCFMLNISYVLMIFLIELCLLPTLEDRMTTIAGNVYQLKILVCVASWFLYLGFHATWVFPMFLACLFRSSKYYLEVVEMLPSPMKPVVLNPSKKSENTIVSQLSNNLSFMLQMILLKIINSLVGFIPYFGWLTCAIFQCLFASFYAFEYHWARICPGQPPNSFVTFIERDWAYFVGFGTIITILTIPFPMFISHALYGAVLPIFIIAASKSSAMAWQKISDKPSLAVLPQSIRYFNVGRELVNFIVGFLVRRLT